MRNSFVLSVMMTVSVEDSKLSNNGVKGAGNKLPRLMSGVTTSAMTGKIWEAEKLSICITILA